MKIIKVLFLLKAIFKKMFQKINKKCEALGSDLVWLYNPYCQTLTLLCFQ